MNAAGPAGLRVAVVGAGPAGFYTAGALAALRPDARIDLIERLPTPYGLVRFGVAPDHQDTKKIQGLFEQIALLPQLRFIGNVELGAAVSLAELRAHYDAVVLSCGAPHDAPLDIPGADLPGVYGAAQLVGWYNGHPDHAGLDPRLDHPGAVVIGNGNVAIDIARILSKSPDELASSDIAPYAMARIAQSVPGDVHVVGRRGPVEAKFTTGELGELADLAQAVALADPGEIPATAPDTLPVRDRKVKQKNLDLFHAFAAADPARHARRIRFHFFARPLAILGSERAEGVRFERTRMEDGRAVGTGDTFDLACGLVAYAIGYRPRPFEGLGAVADRLENDEGRIGPGIYVAGWLRRGPSGKIGTNRGDGEQVAARIAAEVAPAGRGGFEALAQLLNARGVRPTGFDDWKRIEAQETARATAGAPRGKVTSVEEMLAICAAG
ncbi:FAD-dependent oxidoreductase [Xanthobacter sp. KR7-65]|uniref:FAD-dependent oxidoreductase n=1 Tax=Xanthobacter sp. KR7-65 TaxID=3156612 RepID=UPI0032B46ADB